ncbi:hypothetical protein Tco_0904504 [Tanacetum coccineum]
MVADSRLWTRVIKAIHGEDGFDGLQLKRTCYELGLLKLFRRRGKNGSDSRLVYNHLAKAILQEVETLKIKGIHLNNFMQKKLGNGMDTYFWEDLWHGDMVLKQRYPKRLYAANGVHQHQLTDLTTYVEGVVLGVTPDRWYWTLDGSGEFSIASARKVIDDNRFSEVSTQTRWIKAVPINVNIHDIGWKVIIDCCLHRLNISPEGRYRYVILYLGPDVVATQNR